MCVQLIIVTSYDELIIDKILKKLFYNICTTFSKIILYKTSSMQYTSNLLI